MWRNARRGRARTLRSIDSRPSWTPRVPPPLLAHHFLAGCTLPDDLQRTLLHAAEGLRRGAGEPKASRPLEGRHLAIARAPARDGAPDPVEKAAQRLGVRVSHISPQALDAADDPRSLARLLGSLYDAIDCEHLSAERARQLPGLAGIPVFDGLAAAGRPLAGLAKVLAGHDAAVAPPGDLEDMACLVQAALVETMI
jgi:ornithine carbamoyltransferase